MSRIIPVLLVVAVLGCGSKAEKTGVPAPSPGSPAEKAEPATGLAIKINPSKVRDEVLQNELKAEADYGGKLLAFDLGPGYKIGSDANGHYIGYATMYHSQIVDMPPAVICYLSPDGKKAAASLKPDQKITVVGKLKGKQRSPALAALNAQGIPTGDFAVAFTDCTIRESDQQQK